ncbi:hypothetical protein FHW89_003081 [Mucilaginibacter sp. SG564]|nr:hypothetical protein [Mucilaginibacter sp. SG564]
MRLRVKTKRDVLRWLENFESSDWLDALQILEKVTFVSEADMFTVF